jgi:hypothetical protein
VAISRPDAQREAWSVRKVFGCVLVWLACCGSTAQADEWMIPEPQGYHARGFGHVAEIFPPHSRRNDGDRPLCYFYAVGYPGTAWTVDARLEWKAVLINARMPYQALVSPQGDLVTLNEYGAVGYDNAVVIYDRRGGLVKAYAFDALLPADEISRQEAAGTITLSMSSRWWNRDAEYYFTAEPARLYIVLRGGNALEFSLQDGSFRYGPATGFAPLGALRAAPFANERAEVWATSLRFSSISDTLAGH